MSGPPEGVASAETATREGPSPETVTREGPSTATGARKRSSTPGVEAGAGRTDGAMATAIRDRDRREGCGCLDCLNVETATLRRSFPDMVVWAAGLCRRYPSVPALAVAFVLASRLATGVGPRYLPAPLVELLDGLALVGLVFVLRAYVASVAAADLTGGRESPLGRLRGSLAEFVVLAGLLAALLFAAVSVPGAVLMIGLVALLIAGVNPMAAIGVGPVFAVTLAVTVLPLLVLAFKLWLAPEACVVGGYGPLGSLRASWRLATSHRGKLLGILAGNVGSVGVFLAGPLVGANGPLLSPGPLLSAVSTSVGELLSVVWYGVYAHLYVQTVLTE